MEHQQRVDDVGGRVISYLLLMSKHKQHMGKYSETYMDSYSENEIENVTKILQEFDSKW